MPEGGAHSTRKTAVRNARSPVRKPTFRSYQSRSSALRPYTASKARTGLPESGHRFRTTSAADAELSQVLGREVFENAGIDVVIRKCFCALRKSQADQPIRDFHFSPVPRKGGGYRVHRRLCNLKDLGRAVTRSPRNLSARSRGPAVFVTPTDCPAGPMDCFLRRKEESEVNVRKYVLAPRTRPSARGPASTVRFAPLPAIHRPSRFAKKRPFGRGLGSFSRVRPKRDVD